MKKLIEMYNESNKIETGKTKDTTLTNRISIMFRDNKSPSRKWADNGAYIYDSHGDGWFRSNEGISDGYGLIFRNLKLASKNRLTWEGKIKYSNDGHVDIYKATFEYVPNEWSNDVDWEDHYEKEPIWFLVPEDVDPKEAISLFSKNIKNWKP